MSSPRGSFWTVRRGGGRGVRLGHNTPTTIGIFSQNIINICPVLYDSENPSKKLNFPQPQKLESRREEVLNFCPWKQDTYPWKFSLSCPWKKKIFIPVKKSRCPWKIPTAREKCQKCVRENDFAPVKKMAKSAKNGFHAHFWFSWGKKIALPPTPSPTQSPTHPHPSPSYTYSTTAEKV